MTVNALADKAGTSRVSVETLLRILIANGRVITESHAGGSRSAPRKVYKLAEVDA